MRGPSVLFGFYYKGKYYLREIVSRGDTWITGHRLVCEMLEADFDEWTRLLDNIKEVSSDSELTPEDREEITKNKAIKKEDHDSYEFLLGGSFYYTLNSGFIVNSANRPCSQEFIYILDLDNKEFRCKGENLDLVLPLDKEQLEKYQIKWSPNCWTEDDDPEDEDVSWLRRRSR